MNFREKIYRHCMNNMMFFRLHSFITKSNNIHDFLRRIITLLYKLHFPTSFCSTLYDLHYKYISKKLDNLFKSAYNFTKNHDIYHNTIQNSNIIWVFWYQGTSNMPLLVKKCLESLNKCSNGHRIIVLSKNNIKQYARLPENIYVKLQCKDMTLTQFSDILRFNLLHYYGGLWIDSTVYFVSKLSDKYFNSLCTANSKYLMVPHSNMSLGRWTEFFIGGSAYQPLFIFMDEFFRLYWKHHNNLIDYFMVDCALNFAFIRNIGGFHNYVNRIHPDPFIFKMVNIGNKKCEFNEFKDLVNNTRFFKLSYKQKVKDINNTFYKFLLK